MYFLMAGIILGLIIAHNASLPFVGTADNGRKVRKKDSTPERKLAIKGVAIRRFEVLRVVDGDTFVVLYDKERTSVRIAAIDAPEHDLPEGRQATAMLRDLIGGKMVELRFADPHDKRDDFGRLLCHVYRNQVNIAQKLVDEGLASRSM